MPTTNAGRMPRVLAQCYQHLALATRLDCYQNCSPLLQGVVSCYSLRMPRIQCKHSTLGPPYIYFALDVSTLQVKVGTSRDPEDRIIKLQCTTLAIIHGGHKQEQFLHRLLVPSKSRGEWYRLTSEIKEYLGRLSHTKPCPTCLDELPGVADVSMKTLEQQLDKTRIEVIQNALSIYKTNSSTAKALDTSRSNLINLRRRLGI